MNSERMLTMIYFALGTIMGIVSNYLDVMLSASIGIAVYLISFFLAKRFVGENRKILWYVMNTLVTFVLVWLVTWVFVFNL